jgi:phosphoserine aminotransferase
MQAEVTLSRNQLNFSGGPGALPECVLLQAQEAIINVPEVGLSVLGISHRSEWFAAVVEEVAQNIRRLMNLPENYHVLLLQGGATQQFSMVPMMLLRGKTAPAEYLHTGYWSGRAISEALKEGPLRILWDGSEHGFTRLPTDDELCFSPAAPYLHYVSNETVEGLQFHRVLGREDVPRVCDMSSDFLSRPFHAERFSLIYAHAQKNLGPAGVTVVLVRDDLLAKVQQEAQTDALDTLPGFLDYGRHIAAKSNFNTPPVFAIYVVLLVTRWLLQDAGGLAAMGVKNQAKADLLYQVIDGSDGFYRGRAMACDRSSMNVTFTLPNEALTQQFLTEATATGMSGLDGHRAAGGLRASLYNGLSLAAVEYLAGFMHAFRRRHAGLTPVGR